METVIWVATAILFCATYDDFYRNYLEKKREQWYYIVLAWGMMIIFQLTIMWYVDGYVMNFLCNFITMLCVVCFLFKGEIAIKLFMVFISILLHGAAEAIIGFVAIINGDGIQNQMLIYVVMSNILFWAIIRISTLVIKGKIEEKNKKVYGFTLSVILAANLVMEIFLVELNKIIKMQQVYYWCVMFSILILLLDIICLKVFTQLMNQQRIKRENELFAKQLELSEVQMQERMVMVEDVRRTRHDMKNQIVYVQNLLEHNEIKQAQQFLQETMDTKLNNQNEIARSGNLVVDSILNNKYMVTKSKGIHMTINLHIPQEMEYNASDLCIVMGNLMDNATEAAGKVNDSKEIVVEMKQMHTKLYLSIKNTYDGNIKRRKDGTFITTKQDSANHGIGLSSVKKVLDKYDGAMEIVTDEKWFCVKAYL